MPSIEEKWQRCNVCFAITVDPPEDDLEAMMQQTQAAAIGASPASSRPTPRLPPLHQVVTILRQHLRLMILDSANMLQAATLLSLHVSRFEGRLAEVPQPPDSPPPSMTEAEDDADQDESGGRKRRQRRRRRR